MNQYHEDGLDSAHFCRLNCHLQKTNADYLEAYNKLTIGFILIIVDYIQFVIFGAPGVIQSYSQRIF